MNTLVRLCLVMQALGCFFLIKVEDPDLKHLAGARSGIVVHLQNFCSDPDPEFGQRWLQCQKLISNCHKYIVNEKQKKNLKLVLFAKKRKTTFYFKLLLFAKTKFQSPFRVVSGSGSRSKTLICHLNIKLRSNHYAWELWLIDTKWLLKYLC